MCVDAKYQVEVRYWASSNHLQDYNLYMGWYQNVYTKVSGHNFISSVTTYSDYRRKKRQINLITEMAKELF
jgi:hypothetical protein